MEGQAMDNDRARKLVLGPAIGLMVIGVAGILWVVASLAFSQLDPVAVCDWCLKQDLDRELRTAFEEVRRSLAQVEQEGSAVGMAMSYATTAITMLGSLFMLFAGLQMMRLRSHNLALGACVVAMIPCVLPCCSCLCCLPGVGLGIPVGIWGLIVLQKDGMREAFS